MQNPFKLNRSFAPKPIWLRVLIFVLLLELMPWSAIVPANTLAAYTTRLPWVGEPISDLFRPSVAYAQTITVDNVSENLSNNVNSINVPHTTGEGSDRLMLVGISLNAGGNGNFVDSVSYGGTPLTLVGTKSSPGGNAVMAIYQLLNPPSVTNDVSVILDQQSSGVAVGVMTFSGVEQTNPLGAFTSNSDDTGIPTVLVSSVSNELVFDTVVHDTGLALTAAVGQTERWNLTESGETTGAGSTKVGAESIAMSWIPGDANQEWAMGAVSIKPVSGAGSGGGELPPPDHYWTFDENAAATANDTGTVGGFHGSLLNGASWTEGIVNSALLFTESGTSNGHFVNIGQSNGTNPWSVAFWIRRDSDLSANTVFVLEGASANIVSEYDGSNNIGVIRTSQDGADFGYALPIDKWVHLVFVANGNQVTAYVDGAEKNTVTLSTSMALPFRAIGDDNDGEIDSFVGAMDDLKVWEGTILRNAQVAVLYDSYSDSTTSVTLPPSQDTWLKDAAELPNYGTCATMTVDRSGGGLGKGHALVQFDLDSIPADATITAAYLTFTRTDEATDSFALDAYRVTSAWDEGSSGCDGASDTAHWDQRQEGVGWSTAGGDYDSTVIDTITPESVGTYTWTVTSAVEAWHAGTATNFGILIGSPDTGTTTYDFATREHHDNTLRPKLTVLYSGGTVSNVLEAQDDRIVVAQDTVENLIDVLANDEGSDLTLTIVTSPVHGSANVTENNKISYTPTDGYSGLDTITYQLSNGRHTDQALVTIVVDPPGNNVPDAQRDIAYTSKNTPISINVLENDVDSDGDSLSVTIVVLPAYGTAIVDGDHTIFYEPDSDYTGPDMLRYRIDDGQGGVDSARVRIIVDDLLNNAPVAVDDAVAVAQNTTKVIGVLANDSDIEGDPLIVSILLPPLHGTATLNANQSIVYTPTAGYAGSDTLLYQIDDGNDNIDSAVVHITVDPAANNAPNAVDDTVIALPDTTNTLTVLNNDSDADGDPLQLSVTTGPAHGTTSVNPDGSIVYTPNPGYSGSDSLIYRLDDGNGGEDTAIVTIIVDPIGNNAPIANDDSGTTNQEQPAVFVVLANDIDTDNDPLTVSIQTPPSNGTAEINPDSSITYAPIGAYSGPDSLVYKIKDPSGEFDSATLAITVEPRVYNCLEINDVSQAECQALVDIYRETNGPNWTSATNWLTANTACSWFGVTCASSAAFSSISNRRVTNVQEQSLANQTVTELDLSDNNLVGDLPCVLDNLTGLVQLDLNTNQLTGLLPCELSRLNQLTYLDLSSNRFNGNIPSDLGAMPTIQNLRLDNNLLDGTIPNELSDATTLSSLRLDSNLLHGQIPDTFGNLTSLYELTLRNNALTGNVPAGINGLSTLTSLDIGKNGLTADEATAAFLTSTDPDWGDTQTVPPTNLQVVGSTGPVFLLTWTPITYTSDGGFYEVSIATDPNGPYTVLATTADKSAVTYTANGLNYDTTYYFRLRTYTPSHGNQQNELWSDYSDVMPAMMAEPTPTPVPPPPTPTPVPAGHDLSVQGVEFTQAVQTTNNDVPLVAGKPIVARLTVGIGGTSSDVTNVTAELRAYRNGAELPSSPLAPFNSGGAITAKLSPNRGQLNDTLNFTFPSEWLSAGVVTIEAIINPGQTDQDNSNNSQTFTLTLNDVPNLEVVLVPIAFQQNGAGPTYRPALDGTTGYGLGYIKDLYPIADISYTIHPEYLFTGDLHTFQGWVDLLREIQTMRSNEVSDPSAFFPKYYGVIQVAPGCCLDVGWPVSPAAATGGYANNPGGAGLGLEASNYALSSGTAMFNVETHMASHEIGHMLGLSHAPCNVSGDPNFPQLDGSIGDVGIYIPEMKLLANTYKDVMSYCIDIRSTPTMWMSSYHYIKLFEALSGLPAASSVSTSAVRSHSANRFSNANQAMAANTLTAASTNTPQTGWLASGIISGSGITGTIQSAQTISSTQVVSGSQICATHELRMLDDNGTPLFSYHFNPNPLHDEGDGQIDNPFNGSGAIPGGSGSPSHTNQDYGYVLPKLAGTSRIQLWQGSTFLDECVVASAPPLLSANHVDTGTAIDITWTASDPNSSKEPWVLVRYSADSGTSWVVLASHEGPTGTFTVDKDQLLESSSGLIEVVASNCTESVSEQLVIGTVGNTAPHPVILGADPRTFDEGVSIVLDGEAADLEDGSVPGSSFAWSTPQLGALGRGKNIILPGGLVSGTYSVTLTVTDSRGLAAQTAVQINIDSLDDDGDGIVDIVEDSAPNNGDGNDDGILDSTQSSVASLPLHTSVGNGYMTAEVMGACNTISQIAHLAPWDLATVDSVYQYETGLVSVSLACANPGEAATVIYYWHSETSQSGTRYRKYGPTTLGGATSEWYDYPAQFGTATISNTVVPTTSITLVDGELGDATGADSLIVDPGGVASDVATVNVALDVTLNTVNPARQTDPISFTVTITNLDSTPLSSLPVIGVFPMAYLDCTTATQPPTSVAQNQLTWQDLLATAGVTLNQNDTIAFDVTCTAGLDTTLLPNQETTFRAIAANASDADGISIFAPTNVMMAQRTVSVDWATGHVTLTWQTANESQIAAFNVYRKLQDDTAWTLRNGQVIVADRNRQSTGGHYIFRDLMMQEWIAIGIQRSRYRPAHYRLGILMLDGTVQFLDMGHTEQGQHNLLFLPLMAK
ncbi:MAG: Ig-like domain-containing protein [Chloroflexota bacterium]